MSKKLKKRLVWISSILIPILLLIYFLSPSISIETVGNGVFEKEQNTSNFQKSNKMYYVTVSEKNLEDYSIKKIGLVDDTNQEITIQKKDWASASKTVLWFYGKPHSNYKLTYHIQKKNDTDQTVLRKTFSTADKPSNLEDVNQIVEKKVKDEFNKKIKDSILNKTKEMSKSINVYYTPTQTELESIQQAYMATFIRDLSDYKVHMDTATSDGYSFTVTSKWSEPDINDLNRRIDERENQLKQEVGHDYTQLYKRIIDELPDLIRQTPKTTTIKENKSIFKVGRIEPKAIEKNYHFSELNLLDDDFGDPISNILL
ncbi:hypothetical protein QM908_02375 [Streptococcus parasanguinis]|uniref:hypothetical protein n=1 Tax=Streptococcus parasanguinis TaxID=1318 RepID=UPI0039C3AF11